MQTLCHLSVLVHQQAKKYGEKTALSFRDYAKNEWIPISWNQFSDYVRRTSRALIALGVDVQENVAVFTQNKPESLFADFGAYGVRAVTIPFYATSSEAQVKYMVQEAEVRYIFVGEQQQYDTAFRVIPLCTTLRQLIIFDPSVEKHPADNSSIYYDEFLALGDNEACQTVVDERTKDTTFDDLANILYTSGTTGESKGVLVTHGMYYAALPANDVALNLSEDDVIVNFLPMTHIFERAWAYLCISEGCHMAINLRPLDVQTTLREVHPTCMCSVPRFWEKIYTGVQEKIATSSPVQRRLMEDALRVGKKHNVDHLAKGLVPPLALRLRYRFYEKTIIALLKKTLGLERGNFFPTAGATVPPKVQEFVLSAGINMTVGYGATETTATVTCCQVGKPFNVGSVGQLLDGLEIKIGENSEVLLRGKTMTKGYYRKEEATRQLIDEEGWLHTGDAGYLKDGELYLTDRIKDLFKTSNGKYIAPQMLESKLVVDRYVDQISIVADMRKFPSALIVPVYSLLEEYANKADLHYGSREELCKHPQIIKMVMGRINTLQQEFAPYEQIKRITLLPEPLSMEKGELTNTLKIKRAVLNKNYAELIEQMYVE